MISTRDIFDPGETRIFHTSGQHDMTYDSVSSEIAHGACGFKSIMVGIGEHLDGEILITRRCQGF